MAVRARRLRRGRMVIEFAHRCEPLKAAVAASEVPELAPRQVVLSSGHLFILPITSLRLLLAAFAAGSSGVLENATMTVEWMKARLDEIFAVNKGAQLVVTTSRRTPADVEALVDSYPWSYKLIKVLPLCREPPRRRICRRLPQGRPLRRVPPRKGIDGLTIFFRSH